MEQYITELYNLAEFCACGELKDEMLRDHLVVGIRDLALSEKLQTDPELILERAKTQIRQKAAVKEHRGELQKDPVAFSRLQGFKPKQSTRFSGGSKPQGARGGAYNLLQLQQERAFQCSVPVENKTR